MTIEKLPPKLAKATKGGTNTTKWVDKSNNARIEFQTYVRKDGRKGAGYKYVSDSTGWKGINVYSLYQILAEIINNPKAIAALRKYAEADAMIGVEHATRVRKAKTDPAQDDEDLASATIETSDDDDATE